MRGSVCLASAWEILFGIWTTQQTQHHRNKSIRQNPYTVNAELKLGDSRSLVLECWGYHNHNMNDIHTIDTNNKRATAQVSARRNKKSRRKILALVCATASSGKQLGAPPKRLSASLPPSLHQTTWSPTIFSTFPDSLPCTVLLAALFLGPLPSLHCIFCLAYFPC